MSRTATGVKDYTGGLMPAPAQPAEEGGIISTALDVLSRPQYASAAFTNALIQGQGLGGALQTAGNELISPTQRLSYADVIQRGAPEFAKENPLITKAAGFIGDVALDPTTYIGLGAAGAALKPLRAARQLLGVANLTPALEVASSLRKAGLLTGLKTHLKNIIGTTTFQVSEELARVPAAIADIAASAITGRRTITGPSIRAAASSAYEAATRGIQEAGQVLKQGGTAAQLAAGQVNEIKSGSKILDTYINGTFRTLGAEDAVLRTYALRRAVEDRAKTTAINEAKQGLIVRGDIGTRTMQLIKSPTAEIQANAAADAEIAVFTNENLINSMLGRAKSFAATQPGGKFLNFATDLILPFTKTPSNIIARMLEYSPVGFGQSAYKVAQAISKKAFTESEQRAFAQTFGRASVGTALMALGWKLYDAGVLTGVYEDEPSKSARDVAAGRTPGSLLIGNKYYQITGLSPIGPLIAIGASLARESEQGGENVLGKLAGVAGRAIGEQPLLAGTQQIAEGLRSPGTAAERTLGGIAGSTVPTLLSDIGEAIDPRQREARGLAAQVQKRIPFLREALPERTDVLGRPIEDPGVKQLFDFTRSTTAKELTDPVIAELVRLDQGLSKLTRKSTEKDVDYRARVSQFGDLYINYGTRLMQSQLYQSADDKLRKKALDSLSNRVKVQLSDEKQRPASFRLNPNIIMRAVLQAQRKR